MCISNLMFSYTSYIFVIAIATILSSDSRHQYRFIHKGNSTLNTVSSVANQTASLPFWPCYSTLNTISSIANQTAILPLAVRFCMKCLHLQSFTSDIVSDINKFSSFAFRTYFFPMYANVNYCKYLHL